jgi:hypothetical protein
MKVTPKDKSRVSDVAARGLSFDEQQSQLAASSAHTSLRMDEAKARIQLGLQTLFTKGMVHGESFVFNLAENPLGRDELGAVATTVNTLERVRDLNFAGRYAKSFNGNQLVSVCCPVSKIAEICARFDVEVPVACKSGAKAAGSHTISM